MKPQIKSENNKVLVRPYENKGITTTVVGGLARVKQLSGIIELEAVADGPFEIKAGDMVLFEERHLVTEGWSKMKYQTEDLGEFIIAEGKLVVGVKRA